MTHPRAQVALAPNLPDIAVNGTRIKALAQVTKQGYVYTFDRVTGMPCRRARRRTCRS